MKLKVLPYIIFSILMLFIVYLLSFSAIHGEVNFFNDVSRDFLLLQELDQKKIVFIGPRSNTNGLFHGPLLTYIDYPAYLIGHGNPVTVEWFWVGIGIVFIATSFFIARKLFGAFSALAYVLLVSTRMVPHINSVFEPESMYFVMPVFLFTIIQYAKTKKWIFLLLHLITSAIFIQLSIGVGIEFFILSTLVVLYLIYKNKFWKHLLSFLVVPIFTANYILFDVRHNFGMAKALLGTGESSKFFISISDWISNRLQNMLSLQLLEGNYNLNWLLTLIFIVVMVFTIFEIKNNKKNKSLYCIFIFYYFGYIALSYFIKSVLLFHYIYLLVPFTTLWLTSFLKDRYKYIIFPVFTLIFLLNLQYSFSYIRSLKSSFIGRGQNSWIGLSSVAEKIIQIQKGKDFGYFVYSPDAYAYQPRYAMIYNFKKADAKASEYVKKSTTYVIAAPPPPDNPYMTREWWIKNSAKISNKPVRTEKFPNGFIIEEFNLNPDEQKIPHEKTIELGIHFR